MKHVGRGWGIRILKIQTFKKSKVQKLKGSNIQKLRKPKHQTFEISKLLVLLEYMLRRPNYIVGLPDIVVSKGVRIERSFECMTLTPSKIPIGTFFIEAKCKDRVRSFMKFMM